MELLDALTPIAGLGLGPVSIVVAVFARISAFAFFLPALGETAVPVRVRLGAAFAVALMLAPMVLAGDPQGASTPSGLALLIAAEAICGAVIGFGLRVAVFIIQTAGSMAAQSLSLSQLVGGIDAQAEPPVGTLLTLAALALAVATGLHFQAVAALAYSYEVMPFGLFPGADDAGAWAAERAGFAFSAAFSLALPFVILGFVYNLAIGAANRAMPQLMVAFVGAPAITLAGLVLLAVAAPAVLTAWLGMLSEVTTELLGGQR